MVRKGSRDPFLVPPESLGGAAGAAGSAWGAFCGGGGSGGRHLSELANPVASGSVEPVRPVHGAVAYGPVEPHGRRPRAITPPLRHANSYPLPVGPMGTIGEVASPEERGDPRGRDASM
eukprot:4315282-Prymnesium_polylepis.2